MKNINVKVVEPRCIDLNEGTKSSVGKVEPKESDDDDARRVRFDDSAKEGTTAFNDDFKVIKIERSGNGSNRVEIKGKSYRIMVYTTMLPKDVTI